MRKASLVEFVTARRDLLRGRWERTTNVERKVRYGAQKAELNRVLDYIRTHSERGDK